jgi:hypothetical protein
LIHIKNRAAKAERMRERIVFTTLTPICSSGILLDCDAVFWLSKKGEVLVFIRLVYSQKINVPRRIS